MKKKIGRVIEVFLPYGEELTKVCFKIKIENTIITLIEEQKLENNEIYRDDYVFINIEKDSNSNEFTYHIEPISDMDLGSDDNE